MHQREVPNSLIVWAEVCERNRSHVYARNNVPALSVENQDVNCAIATACGKVSIHYFYCAEID